MMKSLQAPIDVPVAQTQDPLVTAIRPDSTIQDDCWIEIDRYADDGNPNCP